MTSPRIAIVSLGCPKALVDTEVIMTRLVKQGYIMTGNVDEANLVLINTCGFINDAIDESCDVIETMLADHGKVMVTGCLGARAEMLRQRFSNLLAITGPSEFDQVCEAIAHHLPLSKPKLPCSVPPAGIKLTPSHYAYLKIAEGCSHHCSFCIIPDLRGPLISRPLLEVLTEAEQLVAAGVKEIIVIAQDTMAYGADLEHPTVEWRNQILRTDIFSLCAELGKLGVDIRLHYLYPYPGIDQLVEMMAEGKILPYLDIPFQHSVPEVLHRMNRPGEHHQLLAAIERWRARCPSLIIRSTFIVGFPGETDEEFDSLLDFIEAAQMDRVGAFKYSAVEGAAANKLSDPVEESDKEDRLEQFMFVQTRISERRLRSRIGSVQKVRVDDWDEDGRLICRGAGEAPEVDGVIYVEDDRSDFDISTGDEFCVIITDSDEHDLWAEIQR